MEDAHFPYLPTPLLRIPWISTVKYLIIYNDPIKKSAMIVFEKSCVINRGSLYVDRLQNPIEANINFVDQETPNFNKPETCGLQIDGHI